MNGSDMIEAQEAYEKLGRPLPEGVQPEDETEMTRICSYCEGKGVDIFNKAFPCPFCKGDQHE
jgi:DnaJ-class molecular chaperone